MLDTALTADVESSRRRRVVSSGVQLGAVERSKVKEAPLVIGELESELAQVPQGHVLGRRLEVVNLLAPVRPRGVLFDGDAEVLREASPRGILYADLQLWAVARRAASGVIARGESSEESSTQIAP